MQVLLWSLFFLSGLPNPYKKGILEEGVLKREVFFVNNDSTTILPMVNNFESRIWFKDSTVIYEVKVQWGINIAEENGMKRKEGYDVFKYTYLDLKTLRCQDYYNLSDTAKPINNYRLKRDEVINWKFYYDENPVDLAGSRSVLPDTVIGEKQYKRIKFTSKNGDYNSETINYLDCFSKTTIFHLNRALDIENPGCQVVMTESRPDVNKPLKSVFKTEIIQDKLLDNELKIFKKWGKNMQSTRLPLLSLDEVNRTLIPPVRQ